MYAESRTKHIVNLILRYTILIVVGFVILYPLLWMVGSSFKSNAEISSGIGFFTVNPTLDGYRAAMENYGGEINVIKAMLNTFSYAIPKVIFTIVSTTVTAYGFGRFRFKGRGFLFAILMSTLLLPQTVLNVPQFILFSKMGWVGSRMYLPLVVPALFATDTYFIFMLIQFQRSVPRELDEAAKIDGCNELQTLSRVLMPIMMPAITACALFQFMWTTNDFMGPLLYVNTPAKYPLSTFVKLSMDVDVNKILALSLISILPSLIIFFLAQDQFVSGISEVGIKD